MIYFTLILKAVLLGRFCYFQFLPGETEGEKMQVTCVRSHS